MSDDNLKDEELKISRIPRVPLPILIGLVVGVLWALFAILARPSEIRVCPSGGSGEIMWGLR